MKIFLINGKAHLPIDNGFKPLSESEMYRLSEENISLEIEVVDHD